MSDCLFCKIINGELPSHKIYEDEYTYAFLDISNDCKGHTLVIPKKHVENIFDCDNDTLSHTIKTVKKISNHYKLLGYDGVNILNANDKSAQQSIFHLHFHILPRKISDNINAWPELKKLNLDLKSVCEELKLN